MDKETEKRLSKLEIEKGIEHGIQKWVRTVCVTATTMFLGFVSWVASQLYDKFEAIQAGIRAFLDTSRHGQ